MKNLEIKNLSEKAKLVLTNKKGCRNESFRGDGLEDFEKVLEFETFELCNTDIFDTLVNCYGAKLPQYGDGYDPDDIEDNDEFEEVTNQNNEASLAFIRDCLETDAPLYCKWLCADEADVEAEYGFEGEETEITWLALPDDAMIVSDMGQYGVLIVSTRPINTKSN